MNLPDFLHKNATSDLEILLKDSDLVVNLKFAKSNFHIGIFYNLPVLNSIEPYLNSINTDPWTYYLEIIL